MYKFNVPYPISEEEKAIDRERKEKLDSLRNHALTGKCTCHVDDKGDIHILNGCVEGRRLFEDYEQSSA